MSGTFIRYLYQHRLRPHFVCLKWYRCNKKGTYLTLMKREKNVQRKSTMARKKNLGIISCVCEWKKLVKSLQHPTLFVVKLLDSTIWEIFSFMWTICCTDNTVKLHSTGYLGTTIQLNSTVQAQAPRYHNTVKFHSPGTQVPQYS